MASSKRCTLQLISLPTRPPATNVVSSLLPKSRGSGLCVFGPRYLSGNAFSQNALRWQRQWQWQWCSRREFKGLDGEKRGEAMVMSQSQSKSRSARGIASVSGGKGEGSRIYEFGDILKILSSSSSKPPSPSSTSSSPPTTLLIDVREPHEFQSNSIPTAINIPVTSQPDALLLDQDEFKDRFGFEKPPLDVEVVFFCKAGVRSRASAGIAREAGYTNVAEYPGSWLDWERQGGPTTKES